MLCNTIYVLSIVSLYSYLCSMYVLSIPTLMLSVLRSVTYPMALGADCEAVATVAYKLVKVIPFISVDFQ